MLFIYKEFCLDRLLLTMSNSSGKRDFTTMSLESDNSNTNETISSMLNMVMATNNETQASINAASGNLETGTSDSFVKKFLSTEEFLINTTLNKVTLDSSTLVNNLLVSQPEIIKILQEFNFTPATIQEFLTEKESKKKSPNKLLKFYDIDAYKFFTHVLLCAYSSPDRFGEQPEVLKVVEMLLNMMPAHKHNVTLALNELKKMLHTNKTPSISMVTINEQFKNFIDKKFPNNKRKKVEVEEPVNTEGSDEDNNLAFWFGENHQSLFTESVKPFMSLGWFFNQFDVIGNIGFRNTTRSTVRRGKTNIPCIRANLTKSLFVNAGTKTIIGGSISGSVKIITIPNAVSEALVELVKRDIRFKDNDGRIINLEFYEGVSVCNLVSALVYNLHAPGNSYPHTDSTIPWNVDVLDYHNNVFLSFDSINIVYDGDDNKITLKIYPKPFISSSLNNNKIAFISAPITKEKNSDDEE